MRPYGSHVYAKTTVGYRDDFKESEVEDYVLADMRVQRPV